MSVSRKFLSLSLSFALCLPIFQLGTAWSEPSNSNDYKTLSSDTLDLIERVKSADEGTYKANSVLVTLDENADSSKSRGVMETFSDVETQELAKTEDGASIVDVTISDDMTVADAIAEYSLKPGVKAVQPNYIYSLVDGIQTEESATLAEPAALEQMATGQYSVNDPYANVSTFSTSQANEWYLDSVNAKEAWSDTRTNSAVTVAVIDTGINFSHIDLKDNIDSVNARYFRYNSNMSSIISDKYSVSETTARYGHGTHVAGIVSARANNSQMFAGVSYNAKILPLKTFYEHPDYNQPITDDSLVIAAYNYLFKLKDAGNSSIKVINLSLGGEDYDVALETVINKAKSQYGMLTVCAAGNENTNKKTYPSDFTETISVTSIDYYDEKSSFSNYGSSKDLAAPGSSIWSTYTTSSNAKTMLNGTSMAAPVVSGAAALLWTKDPTLSVDRVKSILRNTTTPLTKVSPAYYLGTGKLNVEAALASIKSLADGNISASIVQSVKYTGYAQTPLPTLSLNNKELKLGVDYDIYYSNNVNSGAYAKATCKGKGDFSGERTLYFTIAKDASAATFKSVNFVNTTSKTLSSFDAVVTSSNGSKLTEGVDYSVTYLTQNGSPASRPSSVGTYSAFVSGRGTYEGCTISSAVRITSERTVPASTDDRIQRITQGSDAADTASAISSSAFATSEYVIIARYDSFEDAMSATGLAGILDAPILLSRGDLLSPSASNEIKRLKASKAYVIGGNLSIREEVLQGLRSAGVSEIKRLSSQTSWETSVECAKEITRLKINAGDARDYAIITTPTTFEDALSISSFAYKEHVPILLQQGGATSAQRRLSDDADALLRSSYSNATIFVPGGELSVSNASISKYSKAIRLTSGVNAYDTSNYIAQYMVSRKLLSDSSVAIACGSVAYRGVDALAGAALAGKKGGIMLLMNQSGNGQSNDVVLSGFISPHKTAIGELFVLGGQLPMPNTSVYNISSALR